MVCSHCGYDNPREHRYCGMCGTPFPHRDLTVPDAQSTLTFTSAPLEVVSSSLSSTVAEAQHAPLESRAVEAKLQPHDSAEVVAETMAPEAEAAEPEITAADMASANHIESHPAPPLPESLEPPARLEELPVADAVVVEAALIEGVETAPTPVTEVAEASAISPPEEATPAPIVEELPPEESIVAETVPAAETVEPPALEVEAPAPPQPFVPQASEAPPPPSHEEEPPPAETRRPAPFIVPRTAPHREAAATRSDAGTSRPGVVKPPIPERFTPPPASAGMPTFKEVTEASGAPDISPFEPPIEKHPDEDRELKEYVANFQYTPPSESADELTMRSEVPKIDKEVPAEFHHASFDGDVPPPPEAGAHPTGEEYYPPGSSAANRSRFLDISDAPMPAASAQPEEHTGTSFLGLDDEAPTTPMLEEAETPKRRQWGVWSVLLAVLMVLLLVFGGLGYLEGRAQITHAFQGPIEIAREGYEKLRQRIVELTTPAPAATLVPTAQEEKPTEPSPQPAAKSETGAVNPQPDNSTQSSQAPSSAASPAATPAQSQPATSTSSAAASQTSAQSQPQQSPAAAPPAVDTKATPDAHTETTNAEPAKPIEAPVPKVSPKPQPGQQELAKAMDASDPAAAAAWLWKATSRGNPVAPVRLADMYIKGQGVPRSCEQALVLLRSAATKENAPARNRLAALYANGTCVARDRVKAYQLMSSALAADPTSDWAQQNRLTLWNEMTAEERAEAQKYR